MKWLKLGIIFLVFATSARTAPTPAADDPLRLPKSTVPLSYDLTLTTRVKSGDRDFSGNVIIEIEVKEATSVITLHSKQLNVTSWKLTAESGSEITATPRFEEEKDFLHIETSRVLAVNEKLTLEISYTGLLQLDMRGFYRSSYREGNSIKYLATTQFQSTSARYAFICYDEPEFKAVFTLKIIHDSDYTAISNTEGATIVSGVTATTTFVQTPVMSAYLLAFIVSDFDYTTNLGLIAEDETIHRVYAKREGVNRTLFALENSEKFLKKLEEYAKYNYELPKMYSAAIPDFAAGAMENWGLITYKEQYLIGDLSSHPREIFDILRVVAHELGHQFLGNVVTCKWWDQTWLNEGMATVFEYLLVDLVYPDLRMKDLFNINKVQNALLIDAVDSIHPMTFDGSRNSRIVYDKSGSVIRMFQYAVGEEIFRDSLSLYLTDNNHKPVTSDELYAAFETILSRSESKGFDFTTAFKSWENQKGYPVIHVTVDEESRAFTITQERYLQASEERVADDTSSWYIPLNFASSSDQDFEDTTFTHFVESGTKTKTISIPDDFDFNQWFVFNKQQIGYYRVNYDFANWHALIVVLNSDNFKQIHVLNRAQLIDDSLNFAADGYLDYQTALGVVQYLSRETDYIPWKAAANNLEKLNYILAGRPPHEDFTKFVKLLAKRLMVTLGYEEKSTDTLTDRFARELVIDWMCRLGDEKCLTQMKEKSTKLVSGEIEVPSALEIVTICHGLKGLDRKDEFEKLFQRLQASNDQAERLRLIDGLLCSPDPDLILNLLQSTLFDTESINYKTHERQRIFTNVYIKSSVGAEVLMKFIEEEFEDIVEMFSVGEVESVITGMSTRISLYEDQERITDFIDKLEEKINANVKTTALKNIDNNKAWHEGTQYFDSVVFISDFISKAEDFENQLRLPRTSVPYAYQLHIDARSIQTGSLDFSGEVMIFANIKEETDRILFHSRAHVIEELQVLDPITFDEIPILDYNQYAPTDTIAIYFLEKLPQDKEIRIRIKYSAKLLANTGYGFHQTYYDINGERRYLGATNFESSVSTRHAFPHYDEPGFKAIFELKITHDASLGAISNTLGTDEPNTDGTITTTFGATPIMASYLLAFIVSDLQYISNAETKQPDETLHRIWVRPDSLNKAGYALENSVKALKTLADYVGVPFELSKVDSAAIPNKSGAMENWGMVTYRENAMIYEENYDDISHTVKLSGVDVISHELAHQWFGDLVTCEWWSYLWLNEGFATLFEYHITGIMYPNWNIRHLFNIRSLHAAFRYDSSTTTRSMTTELLTIPQITAAFDTVAYGKSGSVLRMFQNTVGEEIFRATLKLYLETNKYQNVNSQKLVDAFKTVMEEKGLTSFDFDAALRSWETQAGYPVIDVKFTEGQFHITQQRFFTNKPAVADDTSSWYIPLNFATKSSPNFDDTQITNFFVNGQAEATISSPANFDASQWFVFNKQQLGYYRVNYDFNNWHALIVALNSDDYDKIHVLNRAQLIDDSWTFAAGGYLDYNVAIGILGYLTRETEYAPWAAADRYITQLYTTFGSSHENLKTFIRHLSEKFYDSFKVPNDYNIPVEDLYERYSRELALKIACNAGNLQCLTDTFIQNHRVADLDRKVPNGLESVIFCSGFRGTGKQEHWVNMWKKMQNTPDANFKSLALNGLGCTDDKDSQRDYLQSTLGSGNSVNYTAAERRAVVSAVLNSYTGLEAVIEFFKEFELDILRNFGYGTLEAMITVPARTIKTREQQAIFTDYLNTLTQLDSEAFRRVSNIVGANFQAQQETTNAYIMESINKIVVGFNQETTTISTSSTASSTTTTVNSPTTTPSSTPSSEPSTTSTTLGASSIEIKLVTLFISFFVVMLLKY